VAELKRLSDLLGDDHDLAVMRSLLVHEQANLGDTTSLLSGLLRQRQQELRAVADLWACGSMPPHPIVPSLRWLNDGESGSMPEVHVVAGSLTSGWSWPPSRSRYGAGP
jgi:hypothetical protein